MLTVITGPMWSGKSDDLIEILDSFQEKHFRIHAFNSVTNHRDGSKWIKSRSGKKWPSEAVDDEYLDPAGDFFAEYSAIPDWVIAVDEGQFFGDRLIDLACVARRRDAKFQLVVAGLLLDSENRPFGPMATLQILANRSIECTAWCFKCDGVARRTYSRTPKDEQVRVGDNGYEARCDICWETGEAQKASMGYLCPA